MPPSPPYATFRYGTQAYTTFIATIATVTAAIVLVILIFTCRRAQIFFRVVLSCSDFLSDIIYLFIEPFYAPALRIALFVVLGFQVIPFLVTVRANPLSPGCVYLAVLPFRDDNFKKSMEFWQYKNMPFKSCVVGYNLAIGIFKVSAYFLWSFSAVISTLAYIILLTPACIFASVAFFYFIWLPFGLFLYMTKLIVLTSMFGRWSMVSVKCGDGVFGGACHSLTQLCHFVCS